MVIFHEYSMILYCPGLKRCHMWKPPLLLRACMRACTAYNPVGFSPGIRGSLTFGSYRVCVCIFFLIEGWGVKWAEVGSSGGKMEWLSLMC